MHAVVWFMMCMCYNESQIISSSVCSLTNCLMIAKLALLWYLYNWIYCVSTSMCVDYTLSKN